MNRIAFLGAGNMASAMVDGLIASKTARPDQVICYSASGTTATSLSDRTGIAHTTSLAELTKGADALIVAFKPQHLAEIDPELAGLTAGKLVISVLSGKRLAHLSAAFPQARNVVRTMPNTPAQIGAGITPWCTLNELSTEDRTGVDNLLNAMGRHIEMPETDMDAATAVSGSGAGFVFEFASALTEAAIEAGFTPEIARTLAIETLLGSARLLARSSESPETLRDKVTSPNGTTAAGLDRLKKGDFRRLIRETIEAAKLRAIEISQDS